MAKWRAPLAVFLAIVGTLVAVNGPAGIRMAGHLLWTNAPVVLIAYALVSFAAAMAARGLAGSVALGAVGLAIAGLRRDWWSASGAWCAAGAVAVAIGVHLVMSEREISGPDVDPDPTRRAWVVLVPTRLRTPARQQAPLFLAVTVIGTSAHIDLSASALPAARYMEVAVTSVFARVDITVPAGWAMIPGRLRTSGRHLHGTFDSATPLEHPDTDPDSIAALSESPRGPAPADANSVAPPPTPATPTGRCVVVVHAMAWGSRLAVAKR